MRKKEKTYLHFFVVLALIAVVSMQGLWLYNTYNIITDNIKDRANVLFHTAVNREAIIRGNNASIPEGTEMTGISVSDNGEFTPVGPLFQEVLLRFGSDIDVEAVDSIYGNLLQGEYINSKVLVRRFLVEEDSIIGESSQIEIGGNAIVSDSVYIRADKSQCVVGYIANPHLFIFQRMGLIIIATALMMGLIIWSIIYQIKIINRQNRIARMRQDFTHALIHDMKTPLSTIAASLAILDSEKMKDNEPMRRKFFGIASDEVGHLLSLTNRVLTISKLENQKMDLQKSKVNLLKTITSLIEKFETKSLKPVMFKTQIQIEEILADEELLTEAISNLIDNAIKYSKESVEIQISTRQQDEYVLISVYDNGIGISQEDQHVIFEKFERAAAGKRNLKTAPSGFGLGLNYVYQVAEAHGGHVGVNSVLGVFSEFIIFIPKIMEDYRDDQIIAGRG